MQFRLLQQILFKRWKTPMANKGEWSEFYAFLKILTDRKLFPADADLNPILELAVPVLKIFRNEDGKFQTEYDVTQADSKILFNSPKLKEAIVLDSSKISSKLSGIFSKISNAGIGQLNIPEGEELLKYLNCSVL